MTTKSTKEILFEKSAVLFKEKGYSATSIRGIALAVGIEPSSIYSHIKSKEELLVKICMDAAHYYVDSMAEIKAQKISASQKIEALINHHVEAVIKAPSTVTVFTDEWKHLPNPALEEFQNLRNGYEEDWEDILSQGIREGSVRKGDIAIMAHTILSSMRWIQTWVSDNKQKKIKKIRSEIRLFILNGIK